jgi:hypothetical protein
MLLRGFRNQDLKPSIYTQNLNFGSLTKYVAVLCLRIRQQAAGFSLFYGADLFDERYAIYFVESGDAGKNLLKSRLP